MRGTPDTLLIPGSFPRALRARFRHSHHSGSRPWLGGTRFFRRAVFGVKTLAALALLPLLSACFGLGVVEGDNKPHPGVNRARALPIKGLDISRYQGEVDFGAARNAGTRFVFIKATEGADYVDPNFARNWNEARRAGLPRGAYHFMAWCSDPVEQAAWFKANVPPDPTALPPVLDLEWNHASSCKPDLSREEVLGRVFYMLAEMEAHTGKLPIVYTDIPFHRDILKGQPLDHAVWLRSTAAEPHQRYGARQWAFWQWTQTGTMPGIRGEVDRNSFYGTESEWAHFLLSGCDPRNIARLAGTGRCASPK